MKQWAAVTTQQGEMREPPQNKPLTKIAAIQGCDSTSVKEPFTILLALRSDLSPHDSAAKTTRMSAEKRRVKEKPKNNTQNNSELPVSSATGRGGTVVLGPVMEQKQRSEHSSPRNADFLSFSVRLTHGNNTEFPHNSSSPADVTPGTPALVRISRIG